MEKKKIRSPEFRASFAQVFTPKAVEEGQKPKYSISMLFSRDQVSQGKLEEMKQLVRAAILEKWGTTPPDSLKLPFKKAEDVTYEGYDDGMIYVNASSYDRPNIIDKHGNQLETTEEFYSGCYALATITVHAYDRKLSKGVSFWLQNVLKTRDGESLSGRASAKDEFSDLLGDTTEGTTTSEGYASDGLDF